jgi:NAD(P)-dependent dehydrogenase (short-subunit alcohol dehydrogenase family)
LAERSVLVTGCSSGIGLGLARSFRERGWHVLAALRDPAQAPRELEGTQLVALDLAQPSEVLQAAAGIDQLDCLINNAGYALTGPFASYAPDQMERQLRVNLLGPALLTQRLIPALKRVGGRIINVSSLAGETGMPMNAMYCAAKHALEGWSEALHHELKSQAIQVALVEPGGFRTRFAKNMEWGTRPIAPQSAEAMQLDRYRAMQATLLAQPGRSPVPVIEAIVRLAEMKTMPLRTRVGLDAHLLRAVQRWLPEALAVRLIGSAFRRRLAAGGNP